MNYNNDEFGSEFLPANLKAGVEFDFILEDYNIFTLNIELNKLLVPTPQKLDLDNDGMVSAEERELRILIIIILLAGALAFLNHLGMLLEGLMKS